jgi:hypothetical protein
MRSRISNARRDVSALRRALLLPSPDDIGRCLPALIEAAQGMAWVESELRKRGGEHPELRSELHALLNELRLVNQLIEHGAALHQGWATLLGAAMAGYTPSGEAVPLTAPGAISVQG